MQARHSNKHVQQISMPSRRASSAITNARELQLGGGLPRQCASAVRFCRLFFFFFYLSTIQSLLQIELQRLKRRADMHDVQSTRCVKERILAGSGSPRMALASLLRLQKGAYAGSTHAAGLFSQTDRRKKKQEPLRGEERRGAYLCAKLVWGT